MGGDNQMPFDLLALVEKDETLATCQCFNAEVCYGSGLQYCATEASASVKSAIDDFLLDNDLATYFLGICQDFKHFGFSDVGYHYVIYRDGSVHRCRPENQVGAHTTGHNPHSIGICYIGGCAATKNAKGDYPPKDTRTPAQRAALVNFVAEMRRKYPGATVHGHNEFANKACPSFNVQKEPGLCGR